MSGQSGAFLKKLLCSRKGNDPVRDNNESLEKIRSVTKYMTCKRLEVREADKNQHQKGKTERE